jgi:hypothetical protein
VATLAVATPAGQTNFTRPLLAERILKNSDGVSVGPDNPVDRTGANTFLRTVAELPPTEPGAESVGVSRVIFDKMEGGPDPIS